LRSRCPDIQLECRAYGDEGLINDFVNSHYPPQTEALNAVVRELADLLTTVDTVTARLRAVLNEAMILSGGNAARGG